MCEPAYSIPRCGLGLWVAAALVLLSGCASDQNTSPTGALLPVLRPVTSGDRPPPDQDKEFILIVRLKMTTIEVPVGVASASEEIWSYLDEEPVRQVHAPALTLNGLRIGLGRADAWDDLAGVLKRMTGRRLQESAATMLPGRPLHIVLKRGLPPQTIFLYRPDRTLSGFDYPPGENLLTISCTLDEDDPSKVMITGLPQIRTTYHRPQFIDRNGRITMVNRPDMFSLSSLTFQVVVPSGDFLVIGPAGESGRPTSVGHHFLVKNKEGMEFETVLVIKPQAFATPASPPKSLKLPQ